MGVLETVTHKRHGGHPEVEKGKKVQGWGQIMKAMVPISWGGGLWLMGNLRAPIKLWKREGGEMKRRFP